MTRRLAVSMAQYDYCWLRDLAALHRRSMKNELAVILSEYREVSTDRPCTIRGKQSDAMEGNQPSAVAASCEGRDGLAHDRANA